MRDRRSRLAANRSFRGKKFNPLGVTGSSTCRSESHFQRGINCKVEFERCGSLGWPMSHLYKLTGINGYRVVICFLVCFNVDLFEIDFKYRFLKLNNQR